MVFNINYVIIMNMKNPLKMLFLFPILLSISGCERLKEVTFAYEGNYLNTQYNDSYFTIDNSSYSQEMALFSCALEMSIYNDEDNLEARGNKPTELFNKIGFSNVYLNPWITVKPSTDSIGFFIASKNIQLEDTSFTALIVIVRGTYYGAEWVSNVTTGMTGHSQGFNEASDQVYQGITQYVNDYHISGKTKFLLTGFSRAGITANLTAGKLIDTPVNGISYNYKDVYAYCFEPPNGADGVYGKTSEELQRYQGIHNILNYNDLVPLVTPCSWKLKRYGTDHFIPDRLTDIYFDDFSRRSLVETYHFLKNSNNIADYVVDDWAFFKPGERQSNVDGYYYPVESINPSMGRFFHDLLELFSNPTKSGGVGIKRSTYASGCQQGIRELMGVFFGVNEEIEGINIDNLLNTLFNTPLFGDIVHDVQERRIDDFFYDLSSLFEILFQAKDGSVTKAKELYESNAYTLYVLCNVLFMRPDLSSQMFYRDNMVKFVTTHDIKLCYAALLASDTRYHPHDAIIFNDGSYYILEVKDPANFVVGERNTNKVVFRYVDKIMTANDIGAEKFSDGSLHIYLPKNGDYVYHGVGKTISLYNNDPYDGESLIRTNMPQDGTIN